MANLHHYWQENRDKIMGRKNRMEAKTRLSPGRLFHFLIKYGKGFFGILGCISFLILILSFTDIPFYAYYRLGTTNTKMIHKPDVIVILSGSGMPGPDGLIRAYYGAGAARQYMDAGIIIALPYNDGDSLKPLFLMEHELIIKGIDSSRIIFEPLGFNTRSQAMNIAAKFPENKKKVSVLLITSPEHMYRAVKTFRKVGFADVGGVPAFDNPIDEGKVMDKGKDKNMSVKSLTLRYNMWSYLHYELYVLREYVAISYYKLKGWI
jgi:uncharacterized SAM-binding protein YcdF (DUF218 family)